MRQVKYHSIRDEVRDLVEGLTVGDALPAERSLAADLGVSRMTLRRAIEELVREGLIERRQGAGTFVAEPKIAQTLAVTSFSQDMRTRGLTPSSRTLTLEEIHAGPQLGRRLSISPSERVLRVIRLRLADDAPMAIETLHVPLALVVGVSSEDLEKVSFYELLAADGTRVDRGVQAIEPTVTDEHESQVLEVPLHSPAFLFERTSWDTTGRPVEFVRSIYRGDRYKLTVELGTTPTGAASDGGAT